MFIFLFYGYKNDAPSIFCSHNKTSFPLFGAELYTRIELDDLVKHESCRDGSFRSDKTQ